MSKEVKRWKRKQLDLMHPEHEVVDANDHDAAVAALLAERDALRDALEHCIDSLGSEYALPPECIKQARAALQGEQP